MTDSAPPIPSLARVLLGLVEDAKKESRLAVCLPVVDLEFVANELARLDQEAAALRAEKDSDDYVAWMRSAGDTQHRHWVLCDSNTDGAFKVYRHPKGNRTDSDWDRLNRVFKTTSDKTIDQDIKIEKLEAQLARYRAPVSDEEIFKYRSHATNGGFGNRDGLLNKAAVDALIEARKEQK